MSASIVGKKEFRELLEARGHVCTNEGEGRASHDFQFVALRFSETVKTRPGKLDKNKRAWLEWVANEK